MRIGFITDANIARLDWAKQNDFRSMGWNRFESSPAGPSERDWRPFVDQFAAETKSRNIRISAIGALYKNPLDPEQSEYARSVFLRAIEVAAHLGIKTVCGFPGAVIELQRHPKGNNPVYKPFENFMPRLLEFWKPLARTAADHGVRIAFEHCPMGSYHLPIMGYNMLSQPAMWERLFNEPGCDNLGLEWDASHLMCQFIEPVENIHKFGSRIFHVHAKDAFINHRLMQVYGICHPGVAEHRFPGFGQANWPEIIHALLRAGYDSDLNIEGWHDPVFRDDEASPPADIQVVKTTDRPARKLEDDGLIIAKRYL
ncbi:MAG TPA: sugar phosphate isomerase/epimerase, partial [Candidatus Dormibacteraeota bacterium]|nr:sugar phosphate isomerase/epimerase [Candidatus Dormibacteraeota bacterium]